MKRYPKMIEDTYIGPYLKKWRKRIRDAKRDIFIAQNGRQMSHND